MAPTSSDQQNANKGFKFGATRPRSKSGCKVCKLRRVRCDEVRPICGHCLRLGLDCIYEPPQPRKKQRQGTNTAGESTTQHDSSTRSGEPEDENPPATTQLPRSALRQVAETNLSLMIRDPSSVPLDAGDASAIDQEQYKGSEQHVASGALAETTNQMLLANLAEISPATGYHGTTEYQTSELMTDIFSMPDSAFSFPTFAFTHASGLVHQASPRPQLQASTAESLLVRPGQGWDETDADLSSYSKEAPHPPSHLHTIEAEAGEQIHSQGLILQSPFIHATYITDSEQTRLLTFFKSNVRPPASLVGVDPYGWTRIKQYLLGKAESGDISVMNALLAVAAALLPTTNILPSKIDRTNQKLVAGRLQNAARFAIEADLLIGGWELERSDALLAAIFLLAWFEVISDHSDDDCVQSCFPANLAEKIIVNGENWHSGSKRLLQWLTLMDTKTSHNGGRQLLSERALDVVMTYHSGGSPPAWSSKSESEAGQEPDGLSTNGTENLVTSSPDSVPIRGQRLDGLLADRPPSSLPLELLKLDIFHVILQPAFEFHLVSQAYSRRIGSHDRHHRLRETAESEFEVMNACRKFEDELQELWKKRPRILDTDLTHLQQFVSEDIAVRLIQLFSVYLATFWGHFLYIHRVAYWNFKHTAIAVKAVEETGKMMRRSVGQAVEQPFFDEEIVRNSANVIHPGLLWTCFLFGCEAPDQAQQRWSVAQLEALGQLSLNLEHNSTLAKENLPSFHLDAKGGRTALKLSFLLNAVIERQISTGNRVDDRWGTKSLLVEVCCEAWIALSASC